MNFSFTFTTQQLIYENVLLSFSFENERNRVSVFRRGLDIFTPIMSIKHQPFRVLCFLLFRSGAWLLSNLEKIIRGAVFSVFHKF